jgi:hypothetical protein
VKINVKFPFRSRFYPLCFFMVLEDATIFHLYISTKSALESVISQENSAILYFSTFGSAFLKNCRVEKKNAISNCRQVDTF